MSSGARYVIGGLVVVTAAVIIAVGRSAPERGASAPSVEPSSARLERVVVYSAPAGFAVCSRAPLHRCTITHTSAALGEPRTVRVGPVDVSVVASCDGMVARALEACGPLPQPGHETPTWLRCAGLHGFFGGAPVETLDPRDVDPAARPGGAELRCDEGQLRVTLNE